MPIQVYGLSSRPMDLWEHQDKTNVFRIDGKDVNEWVQENVDKYFKDNPNSSETVFNVKLEFTKQFWRMRNDTVTINAQTINNMYKGNTPDEFPLDGLYKSVNINNQDAVNQVVGAHDQWSKLTQMQNGADGRAFGYDIETFGDISRGEGTFGITEFGLGERVYSGGQVDSASKRGYSLAVGISSDTTADLNKLVTKFKSQGWDSLEESEKVTLKRLSMYSGNYYDRFGKQNISFANKNMWTVKGLAEASTDVNAIEQGIKNLNKLYNNAKPEEVLTQAMDILTQQLQDDNAVIYAANSNFDIEGTRKVLHSLGITQYDETLDRMKKETLDVVYASRAMGSVQSKSTAKVYEEEFGTRATGASVDAQSKAIGMTVKESHYSIEDIIQEGDILDVRRFSEVSQDSYAEYITRIVNPQAVEDLTRTYNNESVFFITGGRLDKSKMDHAQIGNRYVQNYSIGNEFWQIDESRTGKLGDSYILTMQNYSDITNSADEIASFSKEFTSKEELEKFLRDRAELFSKEQLLGASNQNARIPTDQNHIKYEDFGRRKFSEFLEPASIRLDNGEEVSGFNALQSFLTIDDKLDFDVDESIKKDGYSATATKIYDSLRGDKEAPIYSFYDAQAYVGMHQKIQQERTVLQNIIDEINKTEFKDADDTTKTFILRNTYNKVIGTLDEKYKRQTYISHEARHVSDMFGVDVDLNIGIKGEPDYTSDFRRINAYSADTSLRDVSRIFTGLDEENASLILQDLQSRGVIRDAKAYTDVLHDIYIETNGDINKIRALQRINSDNPAYQLYTDIANELTQHVDSLKNSTKNIAGTYKKSSLSKKIGVGKNLFSVGNKSINFNNIKYRTKGSSGIKDINEVYAMAENKILIDNVIQQSVKETPVFTFLGDSGDLKDLIEEMKIALHYSDDLKNKDGTDILTQMFNTTTAKSDIRKGYDIGKYIDDGLRPFIVNPGEGLNQYLLLTTEKDMAGLLEGLNTDKYVFNEGYAALLKSGITEYATPFELPNVTRYPVDNNISEAIQKLLGKQTAELVTIKQGKDFSKNLIYNFNIYTDENGLLHSYINNGVYDYMSSWRLGGEKAIADVLEGNYEKAAQSLRHNQNQKLKDASSSSTYRGYMMPDGTIKRVTNYGPGDYLHAYELDATEGLKEIFKKSISNDSENPINQLLDTFASELGLTRKNNQSMADFRRSIVDTGYFKEFFPKQLFVGKITDDLMFKDSNNKAFEQTIFDMLYDNVMKDNGTLYDTSVRDSLTLIHDIFKEENINQLLSGSAIEKGILSFIKPGEFNDMAGLYSTMRPTYVQANLAMLFDPNEEWGVDIEGNKIVDLEKEIQYEGRKIVLPETRAGADVETTKEWNARKLIAASGYEGKGIGNYANSTRHITTHFKQISDAELQYNYEKLAKDTDIIQKYGLTNEQYQEYVRYMREDLNAVNEGKWFIDPKLMEQRFMKSIDAKKIKPYASPEILDLAKTERVLNKLENQNVHTNDIIGYTKNGREILYDGPDTIFTKQNINELLNDAETRIIPLKGEVLDPKLMINGTEKATATSISVTSFMDYFGIDKSQKMNTLEMLSDMFNKVSDNAAVMGNLSDLKHGNAFAPDTIWKTITSEYVRRGEGELLVKELNSIRGNFEGINEFKYEDGHIISDYALMKNPTQFIENIYERVKQSAVVDDKTTTLFGSADINANIINRMEHYKRNNIAFVTLQRMNQNEHLAKRVKLDKRTEQVLRERDIFFNTNVHNQLMDDLKEYARNYDATGNNFNGQLPNLQEMVDKFNKIADANKLARVDKQNNMTRSIYGMVESVTNYMDPQGITNVVIENGRVKNRNIVYVNAQEMIDVIMPENGGSVKDLHTSIFFIDGKPSQMLENLAKQQGVNIYGKSNSIYLDLGVNIKHQSGATTTGILIPIQNTLSNVDDEAFFQNSQQYVAEFFRNYSKAIKSGDKNITGKIQGYADTLMTNLAHQLAFQDKDSDISKIFQNVINPNSHGFLAEQETPALFEEMMRTENGVDIMQKLERKREISTLLENTTDKDKVKELVREYNEISDLVDTNNAQIAERIRNGEYIEPKALKGTSLEGITREVINGEVMYGYSTGLSVEGFAEQGIDIGQTGMTVLYDLQENAGNNLDVTRQGSVFAMADETAEYARIVKERLNNLGIDGLEIKDENHIVQELNDILYKSKKGQKTKKGTPKLGIDIRDLNAETINKITSAFDDIGTDYLRNVGTFATNIRFPMFEGQPDAKVYLDNTIEGTHSKMYSPVATPTTNVDFDGDNVNLIMRLNGKSILLTNSPEYQLRKEAYESQLPAFRELIAELVEKGDAINVSDINNQRIQNATKLEKFKPALYEKTMHDYIINTFGDEADFTNDGQILAAQMSDEMNKIFMDTNFNTLTDYDSIKASLAPSLRKLNIGSISTPNFTARDMVNELINMYDIAGDTTKVDTLKSALMDLTNMGKGGGGLQDIAEQKGIDTKHMLDAMTTAQTAKWATGMNKLYGGYIPIGKTLQDQQASALQDIITATRNQVFEDTFKNGRLNNISDADTMQNIINVVMNHDREWMTDENLKTALGISKNSNAIKGLRALLDIQTINGVNPDDLKFISSFWKNSLRTGTIDHDLQSRLTVLLEGTIDNADRRFYGTNLNDVYKVYADALSEMGTEYTKGNLYSVSNTGKKIIKNIKGKNKDVAKWSSYLYSLDSISNTFGGRVKFEFKAYEYDKILDNIAPVKDENLVVYGRDMAEAQAKLKGIFDEDSLDFGAFELFHSGNEEYMQAAKAHLKEQQRYNTLNELTMTRKGNVLSESEMQSKIVEIIDRHVNTNISDVDRKLGRDQLILIDSLFSYSNRTRTEIVSETQKILKAYEYAMTRNLIDTNAGDMLKQLNKDITKHPERYFQKDGSISSIGYDGVLKKFLAGSDYFKDEQILNNVIRDSQTMGSFNKLDEYNKAKSGLNDNLYDIMGERKQYQKALDELRVNANDSEAVLNFLQESDVKLQQLTDDLVAENSRLVNNTERSIYKLFDNRQQMSDFFGWSNKANEDTIVGFGEYLGKSFRSLSEQDIDIILNTNAVGYDAESKYAIEQTLRTLNEWREQINASGIKNVNIKSALNYSSEPSVHLKAALEEATKITGVETNTYRDIIEEEAQKMAEDAAEAVVRRKHITGSFLESAKKLAENVTLKKVGIAVAVMAAVGIANNVIHNQEVQSPLSPARSRDGSGNRPYTGGRTMEREAPPSKPLKIRKVYHDKDTGFNFKVSAKTKGMIDAQSYGNSVGRAGGGNANVNIQNDISGVNDNWLQDKFAQLM